MSLIKEYFYVKTLKTQQATLDLGYIKEDIVDIVVDITTKPIELIEKYFIINGKKIDNINFERKISGKSRVKIFYKLDQEPIDNLFMKIFVKTI